MSERIEKTTTLDTEQIDEGLNSYSDSLRVSQYSTLDEADLEALAYRYSTALEKTDLMPRARAQAEKVLAHAAFELNWRDSAFIARSADFSVEDLSAPEA